MCIYICVNLCNCVFVYLCMMGAMQSVFWVRLSGSTDWRHCPPKAHHPTTPLRSNDDHDDGHDDDDNGDDQAPH